MKISELISHINEFAPFSEAEEWDNCGLIIGSPERDVGRVSVALDATHAELDAAIADGCRTLITHHPIIFPALAVIDTSTFAGSVIEKAIKNDVAIIAVHTNWDKCGLNDALAKKLGLIDVFPFYKKIGVIGSLTTPLDDEEFVEHVKKSWGLSRVIFHKSETQSKKITCVALCGGAGGDLVADAICSRSDVFITAEVKLHTRLAALHEGVSVLDVDHAEMERASLDELICRLVLCCPAISLCSHIQARARFLV